MSGIEAAMFGTPGRDAERNDLFRPNGAAVMEAGFIPAPTTSSPTAPERPIPGDADDRFDWSADNPDIAIHEQPQTAIYANPYGAIVIRQETRGPHDDDQFVFFRPENIPQLIRRLQAMIREEP